MPSSSPSSARHPQYLATGYSQSRVHLFFLLRTAAGFLSRLLFLPFRFLKFLSIRPFSFLSSMNDLTDDDFFNATDDGVADQGDADELFLFGRPHAATEVCNREDRLYLVPYWWWLDAKETCLGDSDKAGAVLYTSNLRSPDSYLVEEERNDSKLEVVFRLREEPVALIEEVEKEALGVEDKEEGCSGVEDKEEGCSSCEYALLYEFMWFKALKWIGHLTKLHLVLVPQNRGQWFP